MNWFHLANLDSVFDQAGEIEILNTLRKIKDMTIQTQRGARGMLDHVKSNYKNDRELCNLFDKAMFYSPDSPKKVKVLVDHIINNIASKLLKRRRDKDSEKEDFVKGLVSVR